MLLGSLGQTSVTVEGLFEQAVDKSVILDEKTISSLTNTQSVCPSTSLIWTVFVAADGSQNDREQRAESS